MPTGLIVLSMASLKLPAVHWAAMPSSVDAPRRPVIDEIRGLTEFGSP